MAIFRQYEKNFMISDFLRLTSLQVGENYAIIFYKNKDAFYEKF